MTARPYSRSLSVFVLLLLAGCNVGPNFHKPAGPVPPAYRGAALASAGGDLGQLTWQQVFTDPLLQELLRKALTQNTDLNLAATRIEQVRQNLQLARLQDIPQINGMANYSEQRLSQEGLPADKVTGSPEGTALEGIVSLNWEIDFWGRYRRLREAAQARLLASEAAQQAVRVSLIAAVATSYFRLREYDAERLVAERSLALREQSLILTKAREEGGVASLLDVRQAETLVTEARQAITRLNRLIPQEENALRILLAENPGPVLRTSPERPETIADTPPGLPSTLLQRRPDIREAEYQLHAANADIGVVRAEYFPNIGLTGLAGTESSAFHNLFTGNSYSWLVQPTLNVPIFTGGLIHAREQQAKAAEQGALLLYKATVRQALRDVSDALIAREQARDYLAEQTAQVDHAESAAFLSRARYKGGVAGYLEVLESERTSLAAQLNLAQARYDELDAGVQLYRALGGGWQP